MQYGGYYLERDRELLQEIEAARLNVLCVVGDEEVFIDFVSDLPAQVFAWDSRATSVSSAYVRELRKGAQASADPGSEIEFRLAMPSLAQYLEKETLGTAV